MRWVFVASSKEVDHLNRDVTSVHSLEEEFYLVRTTLRPPHLILCPLVKTESVYEGADEEAEPTVTTEQTPYSTMELANLQEKYSKHAKQNEMEYVWRISLTGEGKIRLLKEEFRDFLGLGIF